MLRQLSYNPLIRWTVQSTGLQSLARKIYYRCFGPRDGVIKINCLGVSASFSAVDSRELRQVEVALVTEQAALENLLSRLSPGDRFLDVGSEYGVYAILAAKLVGPAGLTVAVEPYDPSFAVLRKNIGLNHAPNVLAFPVALGDHDGSVGMSGMRDGKACCATVTGSGSTVMMRGDDLLARNHLPPPVMVKIDIEGHEFAALEGLHATLTSPVCRTICCEIHPSLLPDGVRPETIIGLIREYGFTKMEKTRRGLEIHVLAEKAD